MWNVECGILLGDEVAFLGGVEIGLGRGAAVVRLTLCLTIGVRQSATQRQVGEPALVQQPVEFGMATKRIVALTGVVVQLFIGVGLGIITTDIACETNVQRQGGSLLHEGLHIVQTQNVALVGGMGRGGIAERTCVFERDIQHTTVVAQTESFVKGYLTGVLVQLALNDEG